VGKPSRTRRPGSSRAGPEGAKVDSGEEAVDLRVRESGPLDACRGPDRLDGRDATLLRVLSGAKRPIACQRPRAKARGPADPAVARRWGLRMNMTEESVREFLPRAIALNERKVAGHR
jgi:hypothetical protein